MSKSLEDMIADGTLPIFPTTYAQRVVDHAAHKAGRGSGRNPSMPFLEERNPRKALGLAEAILESPDGLIRERLLNLRQHLPGQQQAIYDFAAHMANYTNAELVPQGFAMAAALALYDLQEGSNGFTGKPITGSLVGQPALVYRLIEMMVPNIAKAIFPAEFAGGVKEMVDGVHTIRRERAEAVKAAAPKPTIAGDPFVTYEAMRKVADLVYTFYDSNAGSRSGKPWCEDRRNQGVNPFYHQTTGGLFLEQYYSGPGSIWTPWGEWNCWGSGTGSEEAMPNFLASIGQIEVYQEVRHTREGTFGPIYAILKVGDVELPRPEPREPASYVAYEEANRLWDEMTERFESK